MKRNKSRVAERRADAIARQKASDSLTPQERLKGLDMLLGKGVGAKRERAKLQERIDQPRKEKRRTKRHERRS